VTLPPQPVPKTREALVAYEDSGNEVPAGIWYEVAIAEYLNETFKRGSGYRLFLYPWGSAEDLAGKDGALCPPKPARCIPVDFTTDDRKKKNLVLLVDKRWFVGVGRTLKVAPQKIIPVKGVLSTVLNAIRWAFRDWLDIAIRDMPKVDRWPEWD
jgi:hypothetical protein